MKNFKLLFWIALVTSSLFTSCNDDDTNPFIGRWSNSTTGRTYVFNSDMSGNTETISAQETIKKNYTYSYTDTDLTVDYEDDAIEGFTIFYLISDKELTLSNDIGSLKYKKE